MRSLICHLSMCGEPKYCKREMCMAWVKEEDQKIANKYAAVAMSAHCKLLE